MGGQIHPIPCVHPKTKRAEGLDFNGKGSERHFATREGATADVRWGCGKLPIASLLDQPPAEPGPAGLGSEGAGGPQ